MASAVIRLTRPGGMPAPLFLACVAAAFAFLIAATKAADPAKERDASVDGLDIYLLIGGATMTGQAEISDEESKFLERCYLLNENGDWEPATAPLNRNSTISKGDRIHKLGPGYGFAKAMLKANPDIKLGLVVNADDESRIEDWSLKSGYYREARRRTGRIALKSGNLKGILWHHDSSHSLSPLSDMKDMIARLRADFGLWSLPFIAGESATSPSMNSQLGALATDVHATGVASAEGLTTTDSKHFDTKGMNTLGERYAARMLEIQAGLAVREKKRPKRKPTFIDTHVHAMSAREGGLDAVAAWMEKANVQRCIVSPIGQSRAKNEKERELMLANYQRYKGRIDRFCIIEPDEVSSVGEAVDILKKEKADGAVGFGEHYGRNLMFDDPRNMRLFAACEQVGLPVMFHIDQDKNMDEPGMPGVERALKEFPECIFIAHAYWWLHLPDGTCDRLLQTYPNLYADVSGLHVAGVLNRERGYTREFLIRNADRILFGSDAGWWSFDGGEAQFTLFEDFDLPDEVRNRIYRTNAEKLFGFASEDAH